MAVIAALNCGSGWRRYAALQISSPLRPSTAPLGPTASWEPPRPPVTWPESGGAIGGTMAPAAQQQQRAGIYCGRLMALTSWPTKADSDRSSTSEPNGLTSSAFTPSARMTY